MKGRWQKIHSKMKPGDSIVVSGRDSTSLSISIRNSGFKAKERHQGNSMYRVWKLNPEPKEPK